MLGLQGFRVLKVSGFKRKTGSFGATSFSFFIWDLQPYALLQPLQTFRVLGLQGVRVLGLQGFRVLKVSGFKRKTGSFGATSFSFFIWDLQPYALLQPLQTFRA